MLPSRQNKYKQTMIHNVSAYFLHIFLFQAYTVTLLLIVLEGAIYLQYSEFIEVTEWGVGKTL